MKNIPLALLATLLMGFSLIPKNLTQTSDPTTKSANNGKHLSAAISSPQAVQPVKTSNINDDRLMAFYPFNGNADDESGNGHDGTVSGAELTNDRFNLPTSAYHFDGLDDGISLWNGFQYPSMTLCAWFNPVPNNDSNKAIFTEDDYSYHFILAYAPGDSIYASLTSSGEVRWHRWIVKCSPEYMNIEDKWVFAAVVINEADDSVYLYINSERVGSACINGYTLRNVLSEGAFTSLGYSYTSFQSETDFNGKIDEVRIYNDALSPMEIGELYNIGRRSAWTECSTGSTSNFISVSVVGAIAWVAGEDGLVIRTTDDGVYWGEVPSSLESHISNICAVSSYEAFVCVNPSPTPGRIYRTNDAGYTWEIVYQAAGSGVIMNAVWMFDPDEGYAMGNPVGGSFILLKTSDGGTTWSNMPSLPQYSGELGYPNNFTWRDKQHGWFGTSSGRVYMTSNGGNSWSYSHTPLDRVSGTSFATHSQGLIGNLTDDKTAFTMDGGQTWTEIAPAGTGSRLFPAGTAVPTPQWWAVSGNKIFSLSINNPVWSQVDTFTAPLNHLAIKYLPYEDRIFGYAVGDYGIILRYAEIVPRTVISGMKFHDLNGNGVKEVGEAGLGNWTITLKTLDGMLIDTKNTGEGGTYSFTEVPVGEYRIGEILKTDWIQTWPKGAGEHLINIYTGEEIVNLNFGNVYGYKYIGPSTGNWSDSANWTGDQPPGPTNAAIIPGDVAVTVDYIPSDSIMAMRIQTGGQLIFNPGVGEIKIKGNVQIDAGGVLQFSTGAGSAGIICYGNIINRGTFLPGQSYITMAGNEPKLITHEGTSLAFYALEIGGENTSLVGNTSILNSLILNKNINSRDEDTIFVENPDTSALRGSGAVPRGTIKRDIAIGSTGQYRFESSLSYVRFSGEGINPSAVLVKPFPENTPVNLRWENRGGIVNTTENTIRVDSVSQFSKWPFGIPRPTATSVNSKNEQSFIDPVNRFYVIKADGGNGFRATVQLRYEQSEVPPGTDEAQLQLFRGPVNLDSVNEKWNMLSLPLIPDNSHKSFVFPDAASEAFAYEGAYIVRDSLRFGEGFWLKFPVSGIQSIFGQERDNEVIPVNEGWNLIGSISYPVPTSNVASMPPGLIASEFFKYTTRYEVTDSIIPMYGYWIKTSGSGELLLSVGGGFTKTTDKLFNAEGMNKLMFTDRCGNEQSLYFGDDKKLDYSRYELPPIPPDGCYDVRFTTQRMVEMNREGKSKEIPIIISSAKYPVVINWKIVKPDEHNWLNISGDVLMLNGNGEKIIEDSLMLIKLCLGSAIDNEVPKEFALDQNYPNPFNPVTTIRYQLPVDCRVSLRIFNILGQVVQTIIDEVQSAGYQEIKWNASEYASGVYFYKFEAVGISEIHQQFAKVRKLVIIR